MLFKTVVWIHLLTAAIAQDPASPSQTGLENVYIQHNSPEGVIYALILILCGLLWMISGRKLSRASTYAVGFFIGNLVAYTIVTFQGVSGNVLTIYFLWCWFAGLAMGLIFILIPPAGITFLGGFLGFNLTLFIIYCNPGGEMYTAGGRYGVMGALILLGILASWFFKDYIFIISTSFCGPYIILLGADFFARTGWIYPLEGVLTGTRYKNEGYSIGTSTAIMIGAWVVMTLFGLGIQTSQLLRDRRIAQERQTYGQKWVASN